MFVEFVIQNQFFSYSLEEFAQILDIPCEGACVFTNRWRLDELAYDDQVYRIRHEEEIDVLEYQVLTREIEPTLKPLEEIIWENVFCLGVIGIMENPELENESYVLYDRVMTPLAAQLERKPRRDHGTRRGRRSTSSSAFDQPSSSYLNDDDDDGNDKGTSRASTPSLIRYVNSLTNQVPQVFQNPPNIDPHLEPFYTRQIKIINRQVQLQDEQRGGVRSRNPKRKDTEVPQPSDPTNVADEVVNEEMDDSLVRAATTATSLDAEQDSEKKGGSRTHKLKRLYKVGRSARVISSDEASLGDQEDASKQGRKINDIDKDAKITLVHETQGRYGDEEMFDTGFLDGDEVLAEPEVTVKDVNLSVNEVQDKGKWIMVEEPVKMKKKDQISLDEELAFKLQAKEEEERLAREKDQREEKANIVAWDNMQAMIDADYQMAKQMQAEEQEKLSIKEKSKLFVQLVEARKKHFPAMRA
ncbi:hypothetical protein Tco_0468838 [Tanacetum coccineum]